jgi:ABC-type branched-subunit amino acid transport system substrate-binding protein
MMARSRIATVIAATLALLLAACESGGKPGTGLTLRRPVPSPSNSRSLVVGMVGTLSGADSWRGEDAFEGANLAVSALNRALPSGSATFELVTLDDRGDPGRATKLVEQLATQERVVGIVFAGPEEGLPPAAGTLGRVGIPAILCYGDLSGEGGLVRPLVQLSPKYRWEARRLLRYALRDRGYEKVGALVEDSSLGHDAARALRQAPGRVVVARYGGRTSIAAALSRLRRRHAEAVVLEGQPEDLAAAVHALQAMGAVYRSTPSARIASASPKMRARRLRSGHWRPQILGFDSLISRAVTDAGAPPGSVGADSYARGFFYLPLPRMRSFRVAFQQWWDAPPTGWERRAYDAVRMIGWAVKQAGLLRGPAGDRPPDRSDLARSLYRIDGRNFSGVPISLSRHDRAALGAPEVGLWTVPGPADRFWGKLPVSLRWIMLGRGFAGPGGRTRLPSFTWPYLFRRRYLTGTRPPPATALRYGVATRASDPIH